MIYLTDLNVSFIPRWCASSIHVTVDTQEKVLKAQNLQIHKTILIRIIMVHILILKDRGEDTPEYPAEYSEMLSLNTL